MKNIALIGSSTLAQRLIGYIHETDSARVVGMFDDFEKKGSLKYDLPVLGKINDCLALFKKKIFDQVLIAIGYDNFDFRKKVFENLKNQGISFATFIHPNSYVHESAVISAGSIVLVNCVIEMNAFVQENVFLSSTSYISHHTTIGAHGYLAPSVKVSGNATIDECCFLGVNTTVIEDIKMGKNVRSGAGSVIVKDVPSNVLIAGVPAVIKKVL